MATEEKSPRCDSCDGPLVQSRKFLASTNMYWNKPWGSALKMSASVIPYACMSCGRVYLYLGDKKRILREFRDLPEAERRKFNEM